MNNEKINSFSLFTIVVSLCSAPFYGILSSYIINKSLTASCISLLIGFIFSLIISKIIKYNFDKNTNLSYSKKSKKLFKNFSYILNSITIICSIFCYILLTYRLTTFLSNQYLVNTPKYLLSLSIILLTFYISSKGIESLFRVSTICFYISTIIFLFDFASLINQVNLDNFLPIINTDFKTIITTSIIFSFYFSIPLININSIKKNNIVDLNNFNKSYYIAIIISFIILFLSVFTTIGISGVNINNLFDYPIYTTLKRIKLFSFIDSLENISILLWILYIIISSSTYTLFISNTIKDTFNLTYKKSKIINILIIIISFSIPNFIFLKNNYNESYEYIYLPLIVLIILFLIQIIITIKNKLIN